MNKSSTAAAFGAIGLLNNLAYVVMLAGAKSISEGGTGKFIKSKKSFSRTMQFYLFHLIQLNVVHKCKKIDSQLLYFLQALCQDFC